MLGPLPRSRVPVCSASARCRVTEPRVQPARPPRFSRLSSFCFWNPVSHFFFCTNCVHTDWLVLLQREPGGGQEAGGTGEVEVRADGGGPGPAPGHVLRKGTLSIAPWRCLLRGTGRGRGGGAGSAARPGSAGQRRQPPGHEDTGLASGVMLAQPGHPGLSPPVFSHLWRIWLITGFRRKTRPAIYFTQFCALGAVERGRLTEFPPSQPSCAAWGPGGGKGA